MSGFAGRPVAFVGLGAMGMPIAVRLAGGLRRLAVVDLLPDRVAAARAAAPNAVDEPEEIKNAEVAFLCLPSRDSTRSVVEELLAGPSTARTIIDLGAHPPDFVTVMSGLCAARSTTFCDAPVFGTPSMAARSELYFLFSGSEPDGRDFNQLARSVGYRVRYAGPAGTASTIKLLQNALGTANLLAGAEAMRLCQAAGIGTELFVDVVRECGGIGLSSVFDRFADDMAARRDSGEGRLRIAAKDAQSVANLAALHRVAAPLLELMSQQFQLAVKAGMGERQFTDIIDLKRPGAPGLGEDTCG